MSNWDDMTSEEIFNELHDEEWRRNDIDNQYRNCDGEYIFTDDEVVEL